MSIMRCDSRGDLYPISYSLNNQASSSTFAAISPKLWHDRLGHPGSPILDVLRKNKSIDCNKLSNSSICGSCVLGKHIKLPFVSSFSNTTMPFDILHSDLWTSPVLSSLAHRYYVLFLDDYSKYLWTFPIGQKSYVYDIFLAFKALISTQFERNIKICNVIMVESLLIILFGIFVKLMACHSVFLVHTLLLKMGKPNAKFGL